MSRAPVQRTFQGSPEMAHVQNLAQDFETSIEATARRIVELNEYPCAIVFSKDNVLRYTVKSKYLEEQLCVWKGDALPSKSPSRAANTDPDDFRAQRVR